MNKQATQQGVLITDDQRLIGAHFAHNPDRSIPIYDDAFGRLFIHSHSMGVSGIVRARTWEDAYEICEDEFFPEASETVEELQQEYGYRREHKKVIRSAVVIPATERHPLLGAQEKFAELEDYTEGKLPEGAFLRWVTIETPDPDAWSENELFCEAYGFRPNGPNDKDTIKHGIYAKDLNGDCLDELTPALAATLGITVLVEEWD